MLKSSFYCAYELLLDISHIITKCSVQRSRPDVLFTCREETAFGTKVKNSRKGVDHFRAMGIGISIDINKVDVSM
jgi:hypothetical protein